MKILIINQCSTNKGDRAVLFFVLRELVRNGIKDITVSASSPEYWEAGPDVPGDNVQFVPWGWGFRKKDAGFLAKVIFRISRAIKRRVSFPVVRKAFLGSKLPWYLCFLVNSEYLRAIKQADVVISTGGHHVTTIIEKCMVTCQVFDMMIALLYGKPLLLWSQTIGTFDFKNPKNKLMVQEILSDAKRIFIRNADSRKNIKALSVSTDHVLETYESVFGLYDIVKKRIKPAERPLVIGLSVWTGNKPTRQSFQDYIHCFTILIDHVIKKGYSVRLFPMELGGEDISCLEAIAESVRGKGDCEIVEGWPCTIDHINAIAKCRIFVGHKTHSQIFSLTAGTPLLAIAYHKKTEDFMVQFGIEKHCISDSQLSGFKLVEMFDEIDKNLNAINQKEEEKASELFKQVRSDFAGMIESIH